MVVGGGVKLKAVGCISLQMYAKMSSGNSTLNRVHWRARWLEWPGVWLAPRPWGEVPVYKR